MGDDLEPQDDFSTRFGEWTGQNLDWRTGKLLMQDPVAAIDSMVKRGIAPPDFHAPVRDPSQGNLTDDLSQKPLPFADPDAPPSTQASPAWTNKIPGEDPPPPIIPPVPPGAKIEGPFLPSTPASASAPASVSENSLDPEENPNPVESGSVPLPRPNPNRMTDVSADSKKKGDLEGGLSDFAKSLQGVKALQPPPVNPVGTPGIRSPGAVSAPNLNQIMQMGASARSNAVMPLLGRLLAMGKA